ncbi:hypothetical protein GGR52DRAFT_326167 [Hypoxylon sp. FL1284]|nr:hypothetical protein GGR52DRAFT_326167 [Hypoxylon sp. FL1284]
MSLPKPMVPLTGACSVIFDNTLYSYSSEGFESLALEDGAKWNRLSGGHSVKGGVCVGSTPKDSSTAGLFVVGGMSNSSDYPGLQKYTYSTGKWETIMPDVQVTKNRTWHSATYINGSDSILVYSGSQDGKPNLSSQTFTIMGSAPHAVLAFQSTISPPGVAPILLPWSDGQAVMVGGNPTNTKVMLFDTTNSWADSGTTLAEPLPKNTTDLKAALIPGDDGSKHLYTFDLTTSPNTVNRIMLLDASGAPVPNSAPIGATGSSRRMVEDGIERRALTADQWPKYNSTLAPDSVRNGYSIATEPNGLVVMSGGNEDEVLCMFDAKKNSWQNATDVFDQQKEQNNHFGAESLSSSTSSSSTASSTASPKTSSTQSSTQSSTIAATAASSTTAAAAATTTAAAAASGGGLPSSTLLGVVLGSIFGFAIILLAVLFWLKHMRKRQNFLEAGHSRRASGMPDEKDFFRDDMAKTSGGQFRGHVPQDSAGSFSSMAILMGKAQKPTIQRKPSNETKRSSVSSIFNKQFKTTIGRPQLQVSPEPQPQFAVVEKGVSFISTTDEPKPRPKEEVTSQDEGLRRSSGWNRYWSGGSALSVLGIRNNDKSNRETGVSEESSFYSDKQRMTQDSATVPALRIEGRPELNRVISGSPAVSQYNPPLGNGMAGQIERPASAASSSGYSSGIPASVNENWDPIMAKKPWGDSRVPSSAYSQSIYQTTLGPSRPTTTHQQFAGGSNSNDLSWLNLGENGRPRN